MGNLQAIKKRIEGVKSTRQITKAMKMVAASKMKKSQERILNARPYANYLTKMLMTLKIKNKNHHNKIIDGNMEETGKLLLVVVSADRGLCGSFNNEVIRRAKKFLNENQMVDIICIGRKAYDALKKVKEINKAYLNLFNEMNFDSSKDIGSYIFNKYDNNDYDKFIVIYNEFKSAIQQNIVSRQILPVLETEKNLNLLPMDYLYEPDEETIINQICKMYVDVEIWRIMLESSASEQGARMTAMDSATDNANTMISTLSLQYNRERQSQITTEILEVVSGANAINN